MANQLGFYYKPKLSTGKFYNITEKVLHSTLSWSDSTANELLEFTFDINIEPLDDDDNPFTIVPGDEIVITEDENRNVVFRNLTGIVINPGQESTGAWDNDNNRGDNRYSVTVRQKDFSKTNVIIDYKEPITLNNLLTVILQNTDNNLGGVDVNGVPIAKFVLNCPNVDIASADFKGKEIDALNSILTPLGYKYRLNYFVVKDDSLVIKKVITQLNIFQKASPPITSTFALGISNQDINYGMIGNPSYDPYDLENKPFFLLGESKFKVDYDFDSIVNQLTLIGLVQDGVSLKRWERQLTGNRTSDFNLGYKYKDIIFVARLISSTVSIDSVPTFSPSVTFSIDEFSAEKIENYDQVKADFLVCRIVHDSVEYFYKFTISSGLVTLGELAYGVTALPEALVYGDVFELVKSVTIYEDNREFLEGYGQYGVIKNVSLENAEATLKFLEDDIPRSFDKVISYGYKLEPYLETHNFYNSQKAYGIRPLTEEIDFPLTLAQLQNILSVASENSEPAVQIGFTTLRPEEIVAGWEFPVVVEGRVDGIYTVTNINCRYICASGEQGKHLVESQVTMGIKRASLQDTLSGYRKSYELSKTIMSRGNEKDIFREELFFDFSFSGSIRLPAPTGLTASDIGDSSVTLSWDEVPSTRVYHIYLSDDGGTTWLTGYGSGGLFDVFVVDLPDPSNPSIDLTGLPLTTEITAFVSAEDLYGEGALSDPEVFETGGIVAPDTPTGLTATWTNTTADLSWNSSLTATSYKLYIYDAGTPISGYNGKVITLTTEGVTGLSENKAYTWKVKATNGGGDSAFSSEETFKTKIEVIFYASNKNTRQYVYRTNQAKTFDTKLTSQTTYVEGISEKGDISKDGRYFAYVGNTTNDLYIYDFQSGIETRLTNDANLYNCPKFRFGDDENLYFINRTSSPQNISKINLSTLSITIMRTSAIMPAFNFSPDGNTLYFCFNVSLYYLQKTDISINWAQAATTLETGTGTQFFNYINVDNTKVTYCRWNGSMYILKDCNLDGTSITQRASSVSGKPAPVISPNDDKILYTTISGSDRPILIADRTYDSITGYFENPADFLNTSGNFIEYPLAWGLVQY